MMIFVEAPQAPCRSNYCKLYLLPPGGGSYHPIQATERQIYPLLLKAVQSLLLQLVVYRIGADCKFSFFLFFFRVGCLPVAWLGSLFW